MIIKKFNESVRDMMTPKELDIEKVVDSCFMQKHPKDYFRRKWKDDETIPVEEEVNKIIRNLCSFLYENLEYDCSVTGLSLRVLENIDKDALKKAMIKTTEELLKNKK